MLGSLDLFVEADIVPAGSVSRVLDGRHKAMRAHKRVMKAFQRLKLQHFSKSCCKLMVTRNNWKKSATTSRHTHFVFFGYQTNSGD